MSERFCPECNAEVEDAGGYCLLGHSLRSAAPTASLSDLRAEVDRAFEDARVQVAHALGTPPPPPPTRQPVPVPDVPARQPLSMPEEPSATVYPRIDQGPTVGHDPISDFAPAPRMDWGPEKQHRLKRPS